MILKTIIRLLFSLGSEIGFTLFYVVYCTICIYYVVANLRTTFRWVLFQEPAQQDRLARLRHRLDQQQSKLNRLRLLRSQTDASRANNATLSTYIYEI
jgi:hypothetical protein